MGHIKLLLATGSCGSCGSNRIWVIWCHSKLLGPASQHASTTQSKCDASLHMLVLQGCRQRSPDPIAFGVMHVCMYVCVHACMCLRIMCDYIHIHIYIHTHKKSVYLHACMCTCVYKNRWFRQGAPARTETIWGWQGLPSDSNSSERGRIKKSFSLAAQRESWWDMLPSRRSNWESTSDPIGIQSQMI